MRRVCAWRKVLQVFKTSRDCEGVGVWVSLRGCGTGVPRVYGLNRPQACFTFRRNHDQRAELACVVMTVPLPDGRGSLSGDVRGSLCGGMRGTLGTFVS